MLSSFIGDSFVGRLVYHASGHKLFRYKEENENYTVPNKFLHFKAEANNEEGVKKDNIDPVSIKDEANEATLSSSKLGCNDLIIVDWESLTDPQNPKTGH